MTDHGEHDPEAYDAFYATTHRGPRRGRPSGASTPRQLGALGRVESPFFRSKFRIPNDPRHFVTRPRLTALLDDLSECPITAIVAPAGAGKTALAADWLHQASRPCGWLTLDTADQDPGQFWRSVMAVLQPLVPGSSSALSVAPPSRLDGVSDQRAVLAPADLTAPWSDAQTPSVDEPDAAGTTATLVIDDLDQLDESEQACAALEALVLDRPAHVRLVLLSRHRLPLPVERLRAAGELADIHFDALRLSTEEATRLLSSLCPDLPAVDLPAVVERADGWTAALKLTALSIRSGHSASATRRPPEGSSPDHLIDEYLWQEVLRGERPELIRMLLATAVVGRLNFGLAETLTGRLDAGDLLEEAEDRGLFVTSLDDGGWFQVHDLVRDMLLAKYERRWPVGLREQHARAARWFESMHDNLTALDHWRAAERPADVLRVLSHAALGLVDTGREDVVIRVFDQLPPEVVGSGPDSLVRYAWCALMAERRRFQDALAAAESVVTDTDGPAASRLELLRAAAASLSGDWDRCEQLAGPALAGVSEPASADSLERFGWTLVTHAVALGERWQDDGELVGQLRVALSQGSEQRLAFDSIRVLGLALAGRPLDAVHAAARSGHAAENGQLRGLRAEIALADGLVAAEIGDRGRAHEALDELADRSTYPNPSLQVLACLERVQLLMAEGRLLEAAAAFSDVETLFRQTTETHTESPGPSPATAPDSWLRSSVSRVGTSLSLATDDLDEATAWTRRVTDPFWAPLCRAKLLLARGDRARATDALLRAHPRTVRHTVVRQLMHARLTHEQDHEGALQDVTIALRTAERQGMLQTVAADGPEALELIELAAWQVSDAWMEQLRHLLIPTWRAPAAGPIESLTERECEVLRLLPSRLTMREISAHLFVSPNTLKFHRRAIYRKLGVNSREGAVQAAREMRLLPPGQTPGGWT